MPHAELRDDVTLYYEISGPTDGEPLVLIHGLGAQMIAWYPGLVTQFEEAGFRVIRFDNRDVGLSSKMDKKPDYTLRDMAGDVEGLLDTLKLPSAHIAGQSMGGMIAQQLAISAPERVRSLTIIYSIPNADYRLHDPEIQAVRDRIPADDRESRVQHYIDQEMISGLEGFDEAWARRFAESVIDRNYCPEGAARQARATRQAPSRLEALANLAMPASVIHGRSDPLLSYKGSLDMACAIPDAELFVFAGMRHQLPPRLWPDFTRIVARTAARAGARLNGDFGAPVF